jgi:DNA polymerase-1
MFQAAAFPYQVPTDPRKTLVTTSEQFEQMMRQLWDNQVRVFDHETSGLAWWKGSRSCGVGFGVIDQEGTRAWYVPYRHLTTEPQLDIKRINLPIKRLFADPHATWVGHHLKFDDHFNRREGWPILGQRYCTQMAGHLRNENMPKKLEKRAEYELGYTQEETTYWQQKVLFEVKRLAKSRRMNVTPYKDIFGYSEVSPTLLGYYGCHDIDWTGQLWVHYEREGMATKFPRIWPTEMALNEVLADMEEWGQPIDVNYLEELRDKLTLITRTLKAHFHETIGTTTIDPGSDADVRRFLYEWCRAPRTIKTRNDAWSVSREVLEENEILHPGITILMRWREANKILTTWTDSILNALDSNNILHGNFRPDGTKTGRLSSSDPNLQNFIKDDDDRAVEHSGSTVEDGGIDPWSVRQAFVMRPEDAVNRMIRLYFDYSQIELRTLTWYTREPNMMDAYLSGQDIHERTRDEIEALTSRRPSRRLAKIINFGLVYGMTAQGMARQARVSEQEAQFFLDAFFQQYVGIDPYRQHFWAQSRMRGNRCMNIFGRVRTITNLDHPVGWMRRRAERQHFGSLIQGTAGELTKESLVRIHRWIKDTGSDARLVTTIHDDIGIDSPVRELTKIVPAVRGMMEDFPEFYPIPVLVDGEYSTENWAHKHKLPLAA